MALEIRDARPQDAIAVAEVHVRSWQVGYRHLLPPERLDAMDPQERAARYDFAASRGDPSAPHTQVALLDGRVAGFATTSREELAALYVDPPEWGRGIGCALLEAACGRVASAGFAEATLWLFSGNERGARFYRANGWAPDGVTRRETFWGFADLDIERWRRALDGA